MKRNLWMLCVLVAVAVAAASVHAAAKTEARQSKIQMAILLDTSNSMDGLIDQAKAQLWTVVNEFATTKKDGKAPDFEVALYEYGNNGIPSKEGHIRMVLALTTDLDKVSEELFALRTNGGSEYCGKVVKAATEGLAWSDWHEDLKVIFIAGNEPFTQGDVDFRKACPAAVAKGITVNTIFCGDHTQGISTFWKEGAVLADGKYMSIDQNARIAHVDAPQDKEIARLGAELNATYVPYGARGTAGYANQRAQDANARKLSASVSAERAVAKSSAQYRNELWDLVDAAKRGNVKIEAVKETDLPENMRKMSMAERKKYVESQARARSDVQKKIVKLNEARKKYVAVERKKQASSEKSTLDTAIIGAVRAQAVKKNFQLKE